MCVAVYLWLYIKKIQVNSNQNIVDGGLAGEAGVAWGEESALLLSPCLSVVASRHLGKKWRIIDTITPLMHQVNATPISGSTQTNTSQDTPTEQKNKRFSADGQNTVELQWLEH